MNMNIKADRHAQEKIKIRYYIESIKKYVDVDISPEVADALRETERQIWRSDRKARNHNTSMSNLKFEGCVYGKEDAELISVEELVVVDKALTVKFNKAWASLTEVQRRRTLKYWKNGHNLTKIAREEGVSIQSVNESIDGALKKFKKFLK